MKAHQELDPVENCPIGRDPRQMNPEELASLGHSPISLLKAIRQNCISCCMGNRAEVRRCGIVTCSLWPYRMGTNPTRARRQMTYEQRHAAAARLRRAGNAQVNA